MTIDPVATIAAFITAWNRQDRAAIVAAMHPDVRVQGGTMPAAEGLAAAMALLDPFLAAEALDWQTVHIAAVGHTVLTERVDRFRFADGDWHGVPTAGVFDLDTDGRILRWRDYFDMAALAAAMPAT